MKVSIVPEKAAKERSSEIVAYCLLNEQVPEVSLAVMGETVRLRQCGGVQVLQFTYQLVEGCALPSFLDVGFDQEASFLVKLLGQMPEFSDRYDWSGLRLGDEAAVLVFRLCRVVGVRWLGTNGLGTLS